MDLDPSLAFTAVLEMCVPMPAASANALAARLADDMTRANPRNRWEFSCTWLALNAPAGTLKGDQS